MMQFYFRSIYREIERKETHTRSIENSEILYVTIEYYCRLESKFKSKNFHSLALFLSMFLCVSLGDLIDVRKITFLASKGIQ